MASLLSDDELEAGLRTLARWASALRFEDLPRDVVERAKLVVMDDVGVMLGGSLEPEAAAFPEIRDAMMARKTPRRRASSSCLA